MLTVERVRPPKQTPRKETGVVVFRPNEGRGIWNDSGIRVYLTFPFFHYYHPAFMGFDSIRVLNEYHVLPQCGFQNYYHENVEIVTYVASGTLHYRDSRAGNHVIESGGYYRLHAGKGFVHSEMNGSKSEKLKYFQIWRRPQSRNTAARFETGRLSVVWDRLEEMAKRKFENQMYHLKLDAQKSLRQELCQPVWVQSLSGEATVNGRHLNAGDGVGLEEGRSLFLKANTLSDFLIVASGS